MAPSKSNQEGLGEALISAYRKHHLDSTVDDSDLAKVTTDIQVDWLSYEYRDGMLYVFQKEEIMETLNFETAELRDYAEIVLSHLPQNEAVNILGLDGVVRSLADIEMITRANRINWASIVEMDNANEVTA
jgi:hypothetical protein